MTNNIKTLKNVYSDIREILENARRNTVRAVNFEMVQAYWNIGRVIVEEEQKGKERAEYGKFLLKELSQMLTKDYGKGFDERNLRYIREFYLVFRKGDAVRHQLVNEDKTLVSNAMSEESEKSQTMSGQYSKRYAVRSESPKWNALRSELSWTHYRLLMRIDNELARNFYINETINSKWSTRELERQINSLLYERLALSKNKEKVKELSTKGQIIENPIDLIKDPYILEFLDIKENSEYLEKDLEKALLDKLQKFLLELGKGFSFVSRQRRITVDNDHFYVDLVFYNYILKCFFLIDLKTGKLKHEDIGQMDFYVRYFEKEIKQEGDSPTVGLILCADKNDVMAKYTLLSDKNNIFASKYKLYLPSEEEFRKLL